MQFHPYISKNVPKEPKLAEKDKADAIVKFDTACKGGEMDSCYFLASHYLAPEAEHRNPIKARDYLEKSCNTNHAPSCYNLAVLYSKGDLGIEKDEVKACFKTLMERRA